MAATESKINFEVQYGADKKSIYDEEKPLFA